MLSVKLKVVIENQWGNWLTQVYLENGR